MFVYLGSFGSAITCWKLDIISGELSFSSAIYCASPSWLVQSSPSKLFCTNEVNDYEGEFSGSITCLIRDEVSGELQIGSQITSDGGSPTHIAVKDNMVFASNYRSGNFGVAVHNTASNNFIKLQTISPEEIGSVGHVHQIVCNHSEICTVVDLGRDSIYQFAIVNNAISTPYCNKIELPRGIGPRHIAFHPILPFAYAAMELGNAIVRVGYDLQSGLLSLDSDISSSTLSTLLEADGSDDMACSEIIISAVNPRFIYVGNRDIACPDRGRSSIAVFEIINEATGELRKIQHFSSQGKHPRHFSLIAAVPSPLLLVANKDSNNVVVFEVDAESGLVNEDTCCVNQLPLMDQPTFVLCVE